jgi:nitrate reductase alpha subunit
MSMVSHAAGARFYNLIGGAMLSFYDWYADLPVASPQVFGDQTDVPESGDWWDAGYLIMWGANLPVTRTPDAHWMAEARYRGQKVVAVAPDYADNVKFADEWLPAQPGTDGALAMAMGHVILKEFFVDRPVDYFADYVTRYTDLPFLVTLEGVDGGYRPGKMLTAADLGSTVDNAAFKTVLLDADGNPVVPNGSLGFRYGDAGTGNPRRADRVPAARPVRLGAVRVLAVQPARTRVLRATRIPDPALRCLPQPGSATGRTPHASRLGTGALTSAVRTGLRPGTVLVCPRGRY